MNKQRTFWLIFFGLLLFFALSMVLYTRNVLKPYPPSPEALQALESSPSVEVQKTRYGWVFVPRGEARGGFAYYPGGLVDPRAYAPLMQRIAAGGYRVALLQVRFNLAVTEQGKARQPIAEQPELRWAVGGHSLGGVVASNFAQSNPDARATVFFASYPQNDLSTLALPALSLIGSTDKVVGAKLEAAKAKFPKNTQFAVIEGLNHAGFGGYGPQRGDGEATISKAAGWDEIARRTLDFLDQTVGKR